MTVFDILGFALLGIAGAVILLRLFRVLDWSWAAALFPLFLFFIFQIVVAVVSGVSNYLGYMGGLGSKLLNP